MKKKCYVLSALFLCLGLALTGCGGATAPKTQAPTADTSSDENTQSPATDISSEESTPSETEAAVSSPATEGTVTIMRYAPIDQEAFDVYHNDMLEATGVDIQFIYAPSDYNDNVIKQTTLLSSGDSSIDIFHCDEPMLSTFMNAGFLAPITDVMEPYVADFPGAYVESMCTLDGDIFAVTTEVQPVMLYVNRELFEAAGLDYPTTQDEFVECAKALTQGDVYGYGAAWSKGFMYNCVERWMYNFNGDFFDWNNENSKKAIQFMYDCINTTGITPMAVLGDDYDALGQKMADGKYAMMFQWQYITGIYRDAGIYGDGGKIEIIPMPMFANNDSLTGGWQFVLNKSSKNQEAAKKVLSYMASPEGQEAFGIVTSQIPANSAALESPELKEQIAGLDWALKYIEETNLLPRPTDGKINEIIDSTESILQMYFTDEIDLETCVKNAQAEIDRLRG